MGKSNSGVDAFLLGVEVELELKFLIRYGVGVAYPRSCPSLPPPDDVITSPFSKFFPEK